MSVAPTGLGTVPAVGLIAGLELRRRFRDRSFLLQAIVGPVVLATIVSVALGGIDDDLDVTVGIVDLDRSAISSRFVRGLSSTDIGGIEFVRVRDEADARSDIDSDEIGAAVVVPDGFAASLATPRPASVEVMAGAQNPVSGEVARSVARNLVARVNAARLAATTALASEDGRLVDPDELAAIELPVEISQDEAGDDVAPAAFFGPSMGMLFLFLTIGAVARGLLTDARLGVLDRVRASPVPAGAILGGKVACIVVVGLVSMFVMWAVSSVTLGADWGNPGAVAVLIACLVLAVGGISALIAAFARTEQAAETMTNVVTFVFALLGGNFIPPGDLPDSLVAVSSMTPNGWALRGFAELSAGATLGDILPNLAVLLAWAAVTGTIGVVGLTRRMEGRGAGRVRSPRRAGTSTTAGTVGTDRQTVGGSGAAPPVTAGSRASLRGSTDRGRRGERTRVVTFIALNELRRLVRQPIVLFFSLLLPVVIMVIIGATFGGTDRIEIGIIDRDRSDASADLVDELEGADGLVLRRYVEIEQLRADVRGGVVTAGVVIPPRYQRRIDEGGTVSVDLVANPTSQATSAVRAAVDGAVAEEAIVVAAARHAAEHGGPPTAESLDRASALALDLPRASVRETVVSGGGAAGRYAYTAPSNMVLFVFANTLAVGAVLAADRQEGLVRRMLVTPNSSGTILAGIGAAKFLFAVVQSALIIAIGSLVFGVNWGSPLGAASVAILFAAVATGVGLLVGATVTNGEQIQSIAIPLGIGMAMLGGCMWPLEIVPPAVRTLGHAFPHAWAMDAWVDLIFEDGSVFDIAPELAVLAGFAVVLGVLGARRLRTVTTG